MNKGQCLDQALPADESPSPTFDAAQAFELAQSAKTAGAAAVQVQLAPLLDAALASIRDAAQLGLTFAEIDVTGQPPELVQHLANALQGRRFAVHPVQALQCLHVGWQPQPVATPRTHLLEH